MITDAILGFFQAVIVWAGGLLPTWDISVGTTGWGQALAHMSDLNYFLPIQEVFTVTLAAFLLFPAFMGVTLVVWLIALIRGGSARA